MALTRKEMEEIAQIVAKAVIQALKEQEQPIRKSETNNTFKPIVTTSSSQKKQPSSTSPKNVVSKTVKASSKPYMYSPLGGQSCY